MGKDTNAALKAYDKVETRLLEGDLTLLKDAAGSEIKMGQIVETFNRVLPPKVAITQDQQRFERALVTTLDAMDAGRTSNRKDPIEVGVEIRPLPHIRHALERLAEDRLTQPFETQAERTAFRVEIESNLSDEHLEALRDGNAEVLAPILGDWLDEKDQLTLALAYYQHADVEVPNEVLRSVVDRLADVEQAETHTHRDRGLTH